MLRVIKAAQRLGFSLQELADLIDVGTHRHGRRPEGLQARARHKLAEVDARIVDPTIIRQTLQAALATGCENLITCAPSPQCPLPFADLAHDPATSRSEHDNGDAR